MPFNLEVPLDASSVKEFKPDRAVKVVAYGSHGLVLEQLVKLDDKGQGRASFSFKQDPGSLRLALGPDTASAESLKNLQTIAVNVPAAEWKGKNSLRISPVAISTFYWRWWWFWCRDFKVTGRVLCADGSPVAGASVCAFDVDSWWWWTSKEQVGCATTASDGSFEIDFVRCCGWFPWWWWETREWLLDPFLVEEITAVFKNDPRIGKLPRALPMPNSGVFDQLLASAARDTRGGLPPSLAVKGNLAASHTPVNPNELESLRGHLLKFLPREFPLPIWPWRPWWPWWDCGANIIFQVTQNCSGQLKTIVNETVADTRWDAPTNLNVTLTTNDEACCVYVCPDCPEGTCLLPSDICDINVGSIGGNVGNVSLPAQLGLVNPGVQDRPFAGLVSFFGRFGDSTPTDYYEFQYSATGVPGSFNPLPLGALTTIVRQVFVTVPTFSWLPIAFPANTISDGAVTHNVFETIHHYEANNGPQLWDSQTHDELLLLNSANVLPNGTYYLQLVGYQRPGYAGNLTNPVVLPVCDPNPDHPAVLNYWVVTLDNQAPGNTDPTGQPCGLHICTDQPVSDIIQVTVAGTVVGGCGMVCINEGDQLVIDFAAYDPDGFLASYGLELLYSTDLSVNLLNPALFTTWSLAPSPAPPVWAPAAAQVGPDYGSALAEGAVSPVWSGGAMRLTVNASGAFPILPCAYLLQLNVYKRPIVNCDVPADVQQNVSFQSFTVQACPPIG
jgi:hypothetical protein